MRGGQPIRVCLFGDGSNVHLRRWAVDVAARGCEVAVLSVGGTPPISGILVHCVASTPDVLRRLVSAHDARRFLRRFAPQIVHVHFLWRGVRTVAARHGGGFVAVFYALAGTAVRGADYVITPAHSAG
jgi:hypothetical protein